MFGSNKDIYKKIDEVLEGINSRDLYPDIRTIEGKSIGNVVMIGGKKETLFCGYDYLGLGSNQELISEIQDGLESYGTQSGGTPLVSGTLDVHKRAEESVSSLLGTEAAMLFTSGALANIGVIPAIMSMPMFSAEFLIRKFLFLQQESYIFSDELNHATIVDGCRLSKSKIIVYDHKNLDDLNTKIKHYRSGWKMIITDGVFSMDGDIAPLAGLAEIAKSNNSWLMVDDAHSVGVLGKTGAGTAEHLDLKGAVDITTGALGKALSILGGYAAVSRKVSDYLRITARPGIFSGSIPPALALGLIKSIEIVKKSQRLRENLWENAKQLRGGLKNLSLDTFYSEDPVPIVPLMIGEDMKAVVISRKLQELGFFAPAIRWPAVPKGTARIRFTVQANNTRSEISSLLNAIGKLDKEYKFSK